MKCFLKQGTSKVDGCSFFSGYFFDGLRMYQGEEAIRLLKNRDGSIKNKVSSLYGSFFYIFTDEADRSYLVTDWVRSRPLFYTYSSEGELLVSDVDSLPKLYKDHGEIDEEAAIQVKVLSYTVGKRTLLKGVWQIPAGCILEVFQDKIVSEANYIDFLTPETVSRTDIYTRLLEAYDRAFDRMIIYLAGRQALVPLSGGIDSRFVLQGLVKKGYKNIIAYTYGKEIVGEAVISQQVARALHVPWKFIYYDPDEMQKLFRGENYKKLVRIAGNITSNPIISDWYVLYYLKKNKCIESNAVNLVGHSAASIGEELTRKELSDRRTVSMDEAVGLYMQIAAMFTDKTMKYRNHILKYLKSELPTKLENLNSIDAYTEMKRLYYFGRHTNYLLNSVKTGVSLGIDWYCPLVDGEIARIWNLEIPRNLSDRRILYREIIDKYVGGADNLPRSSSEGEGTQLVKKTGWKRQLQNIFKGTYRFYLSIVKMTTFDRNLQGYFTKRELLKAIMEKALIIDPLVTDKFLKFFRKELRKECVNEK